MITKVIYAVLLAAQLASGAVLPRHNEGHSSASSHSTGCTIVTTETVTVPFNVSTTQVGQKSTAYVTTTEYTTVVPSSLGPSSGGYLTYPSSDAPYLTYGPVVPSPPISIPSNPGFIGVPGASSGPGTSGSSTSSPAPSNRTNTPLPTPKKPSSIGVPGSPSTPPVKPSAPVVTPSKSGPACKPHASSSTGGKQSSTAPDKPSSPAPAPTSPSSGQPPQASSVMASFVYPQPAAPSANPKPSAPTVKPNPPASSSPKPAPSSPSPPPKYGAGPMEPYPGIPYPVQPPSATEPQKQSSTAVVVVPITPSSTAVVVKPIVPTPPGRRVDDTLTIEIITTVDGTPPPSPSPTKEPKEIFTPNPKPSPPPKAPESQYLSPKPTPTRKPDAAPPVKTEVLSNGPHCPYPYPGEVCGGKPVTTVVTEPKKPKETPKEEKPKEEKPKATGWCPYPGQVC